MNKRPSSPACPCLRRHHGLPAILLCMLTACGGGQSPTETSGDEAQQATPRTQSAASTPTPTPTAAVGASQRLASREDGVVPKGAASPRVPVYRFFNTLTSAHFFTTSETEKANLIASQPFMHFDGTAFSASNANVSDLSPVHRFYNVSNGVHFYTISEDERTQLTASSPQFHYEGVAYYASTLPGTGYTALYRFYYGSKGFHFYTASAAERDAIVAHLPQYSYEGIGYYVLDSDWQTPAVPHTGVTTGQCYMAGSNSLVTCAGLNQLEAIHLNAQQDGHRTFVNTMSFSAVGNQALTECVKDNVTGLVWEGIRPGDTNLRYSNTGTSKSGLDAFDHVVSANAAARCGFTDWRLPSVEELQTLVDYGITAPSPAAMIPAAWFPNTAAEGYWSNTPKKNDSSRAWSVDFAGGGGSANADTRTLALAVRLVRGAPWTGTRYLVATAAYPGDAGNNAALDRKTGLTWRRCLEGYVWNGTACAVSGPATFTHEEALVRARDRTGWRLPNIKELASLPDISRSSPDSDLTLFTGTGSFSYWTWSSTPRTTVPTTAWGVQFFNSNAVTFANRSSPADVRLVFSRP